MKSKKLVSLVLCLLMCFSFAMTAFAADATITLTGTDGDTYEAYMVFSATTVGDKIGYTPNPDFDDFFTDAKIAPYTNAVDYVKAQSSAADAAKLSEELMNYVIAKGLTPEDSGTSTLEVDKGYYLIIEEENNTGARSLAMLEVTTSSHNVAVKSSAPTLTLKVFDDDTSAYIDIADTSVTETLKYKLAGTVTSMAGYTSYTYNMNVEIEDGLEFGEIESVKFYNAVGDEVSATGINYVAPTAANTTTIQFTGMKNAATQNIASVEVIFTVNATNDIVLGNNGNLVSANLTYSNDPYDLSSTDDTVLDHAIVYTYTLDVEKIDAIDDSHLSGATFSLYSDAAATQLVSLLPTGTANTYKVVAAGTTGAVTQITTDDAGLLYIEGLDATTWYLKEITPPVGYNALVGVMDVAITATYDSKDNAFALGDRDGLATISSNYNATATGAKIVVENSVGGSLPQMGGEGTTQYKVVGLCSAGFGIVILAACYMIISKKKRNS